MSKIKKELYQVLRFVAVHFQLLSMGHREPFDALQDESAEFEHFIDKFELSQEDYAILQNEFMGAMVCSPDFSGDMCWPLRHPHHRGAGAAHALYEEYNEIGANMWSTADLWGRLRRLFCGHIAAEFRRRAEQLLAYGLVKFHDPDFDPAPGEMPATAFEARFTSEMHSICGSARLIFKDRADYDTFVEVMEELAGLKRIPELSGPSVLAALAKQLDSVHWFDRQTLVNELATLNPNFSRDDREALINAGFEKELKWLRGRHHMKDWLTSLCSAEEAHASGDIRDILVGRPCPEDMAMLKRAALVYALDGHKCQLEGVLRPKTGEQEIYLIVHQPTCAQIGDIK